jgi:hypothetical protein
MKNTDPSALLPRKHSNKVNKLAANLTKHEGTCWKCGKKEPKYPECPTKNNHSPYTSREKAKIAKINLLKGYHVLRGKEQIQKAVRVWYLFQAEEHACAVICAIIWALSMALLLVEVPIHPMQRIQPVKFRKG